MLLGVDIGGTKTLIGVLDRSGHTIARRKFPTPKSYNQFLDDLAAEIAKLSSEKPEAAAVAVPGRLDRKNGVAITFGNLDWKNVSIVSDISGKIGCDVYIENDANLAALAEASALKNKESRTLYLTISTGIGSGVVQSGRLDEGLIDSEAGSMLLPFEGKLLPWEHFASGSAIVRRYGKIAADIDDPEVWKKISDDFAIGIVELCAVVEPDTVVIGGGVGSHFDKFGSFLKERLNAMLPPMIKQPVVLAAVHAEEATFNGCIELLRQKELLK